MKKLFLIFVIIAICMPIALLLLLSLFTYYRFPLVLPMGFTLDYWRSALNNPLLLPSLKNSLMIGCCTGILSTIIGIMAARALVSYRFWGRKIIRELFTIPLLMPAVALFLGMHLIMLRLGIANGHCGIVIAHLVISIPYTINIFISLFKGISPELEAVASTLGCRPLGVFFKILLPLIMPGIYLSFSLSFIISFSEYFSSFLMGGGRIVTFATLMYPYINNSDIGHGAVLGIVFLSINLLVFFAVERISGKRLKLEGYLYE